MFDFASINASKAPHSRLGYISIIYRQTGALGFARLCREKLGFAEDVRSFAVGFAQDLLALLENLPKMAAENFFKKPTVSFPSLKTSICRKIL
jgi:hypothetical protein